VVRRSAPGACAASVPGRRSILCRTSDCARDESAPTRELASVVQPSGQRQAAAPGARVCPAQVLNQRGRSFVAATAPTGFEDVRNRAGAERVARQREGAPGGEFVWAVIVDQREQAGRVGAQGVAPRRPDRANCWGFLFADR
jgi:hypothetical protein